MGRRQPADRHPLLHLDRLPGLSGFQAPAGAEPGARHPRHSFGDPGNRLPRRGGRKDLRLHDHQPRLGAPPHGRCGDQRGHRCARERQPHRVLRLRRIGHRGPRCPAEVSDVRCPLRGGKRFASADHGGLAARARRCRRRDLEYGRDAVDRRSGGHGAGARLHRSSASSA